MMLDPRQPMTTPPLVHFFVSWFPIHLPHTCQRKIKIEIVHQEKKEKKSIHAQDCEPLMIAAKTQKLQKNTFSSSQVKHQTSSPATAPSPLRFLHKRIKTSDN
jgi:hypothetical protein